MTPILLDQGLHRSAAVHLRTVGIDAVHVGELGMSQATDSEILDFARRNRRFCVTLDADFHALSAVRSDNSPSVVRIRIEGLQGAEMAELLLRIWPRIERVVASAGAMVTVTHRSIRIRRLPV